GALVQELAQYGERVRGTAVRRLAAGAAPRGDQREGRRRVTRAVQGRLGTDVLGLESRGETDRIGVAGEFRLDDVRQSVERAPRLRAIDRAEEHTSESRFRRE